MLDQTTRSRELAAILSCVQHVLTLGQPGRVRLLDVGCGNGLALASLRHRFPALALGGVDYTPDMVDLARERRLPDCEIRQGDVRELAVDDATFDIVVSERCLINIVDAEGQRRALHEIHRVLRPGGHLIMIEAFVAGATNLNRARAELGLDPLEPPTFNRWLDEGELHSWLEGRFDEVGLDEPTSLPTRNFLSSHYFVSRVVYPALTTREVLYNTEFVRFFDFLPPRGDYSPIRLYLLRSRRGSP